MARGTASESRALMIYPNHYAMLSELTDEERGRLLMALLDYSDSGAEPAFTGGLRIAYVELRGDVDRSIARWEAECRRRSDAGKKSAALRAAKNFASDVSCNDSFSGEADGSGQDPAAEAAAAREALFSSVEDSSAKSTNQNQNSSQNQNQNSNQNQNKNQNENQNGSSPRKPPEGRDADFERFWDAYPKKVGKQNARRAFSHVDVPLDRLLSSLERQRGDPQWQRENGRFIPNPSTWLSQGRWDDEPPPGGGIRRHGAPMDPIMREAVRNMIAQEAWEDRGEGTRDR